MSGSRAKFSGDYYRKKREKIDNLMKKVPKISDFMTRSTNSSDNDQQPACSSHVTVVSILL